MISTMLHAHISDAVIFNWGECVCLRLVVDIWACLLTKDTHYVFAAPGFCPLLARSSFINLSPPYSCPNPSLSPQSDQDMSSQETAGIQDRSGWREWNGGDMIKANWTHICAFSHTDACCQLVHYCTLPLSDIWVTRQIIITNSQWSIQRLSRWVTN